MAGSSFGNIFRITTWGESHGKALGVVVDGVPAVITALGGIMSIPGFSDFAEVGVSTVVSVFEGIGEVGLQLAGVCAAAVIMGQFDIASVAEGLGAIGLVIGGMEVILIALGGLMQLEGFQWIVSEGGKALAQLGNIIGEFAGSIVGGLVEAVTDAFPAVGTNLSDFMENAQGFFDGLSKIDADIFSAIESLATAFLVLTAAKLLDGISSFFGSKKTIDGFIGMLPSLGEGVAAFANATADINAEKTEAAGACVEIIAKFTDAVPRSGGLLQKIGGEKDYQTFFNFLPTMADKLVEFSERIENLKTDAVEKTKASVDIIMAYANAVPKTGLLQKITGEPDYQNFITYMPKLATAMVKYSKNISTLDVDVINKTDDTVNTLIAYANTIPKTGGLIGLIGGGNPAYKDFVTFLPALGAGMKQYYINVAPVKADVVERSAYAAQALAELANNLPESGAFWGLFDSDMEDFGEDIADFGEYFAEYYNYIKDINSTKANNISDAIASLVNTAQIISSAGITNTIADFAKGLKGAASDIKSFFDVSFGYTNGFWIGHSFGEYIVTGMKSALKSASWEYKTYDSVAGGFKLLPTFAEGGFVDEGQLFIANEAGAELVGNIGRRTAVANGDQIVDAVALGVAEANNEQNALLREQNALLRSLLAKDSSVVANITTDSLIDALDRTNRRAGKTIIPVGV